MKNLKFELSVLFTKRKLTPISGNELIKDEYLKMFRKEVKDEDLAEILEEIILDQSGQIQEIPEDFELQ